MHTAFTMPCYTCIFLILMLVTSVALQSRANT